MAWNCAIQNHFSLEQISGQDPPSGTHTRHTARRRSSPANQGCPPCTPHRTGAAINFSTRPNGTPSIGSAEASFCLEVHFQRDLHQAMWPGAGDVTKPTRARIVELPRRIVELRMVEYVEGFSPELNT